MIYVRAFWSDVAFPLAVATLTGAAAAIWGDPVMKGFAVGVALMAIIHGLKKTGPDRSGGT